MAYARANGLRGTGRVAGKRTTRKGVSNSIKVRYQKPSARNQQKQILSNARTLARHAKLLQQHKIYTDWQFSSPCVPAISGDWSVQRLTDFTAWTSVLRQDPIVAGKSHTFVLRSQINIRCDLGNKDFAAFNVFIVTKRKNANQYDPFTTSPSLGEEYIENAQQQGFNLRLNPSVYKVHYAKYATLTQNSLFNAAVPTQTVGMPTSSYRKMQVNLPLKMSVTQPALHGLGTGPWLDMHFENLPPYHQYFLMVNASWGGTGAIAPSLNFDQLATCVNTA